MTVEMIIRGLTLDSVSSKDKILVWLYKQPMSRKYAMDNACLCPFGQYFKEVTHVDHYVGRTNTSLRPFLRSQPKDIIELPKWVAQAINEFLKLIDTNAQISNDIVINLIEGL